MHATAAVQSLPTGFPTLLHVATIALDAEGQAFAFDPTQDDVIWTISRPNREVRSIRLPAVPLDRPDARPF